MSMQLDLGAVSAYAVAVANGYVGTEAQWETEIANASANAQAARTARVGAEDAQQAAETAQGEAEDARDDAEKYALGTVGGAAVPVSDSAYHNNAKYYAEQAGASNTGAGSAKTDAETAAGNAEAYSVGTRDGVAVESTDPAYHNNAKYYSDQAADANTNAGIARTGAETAAENAEAYAVGTRGGDAVDSEDVTYHNNARYYSEQAASEKTDAAASALKAEGYAVGKQNGSDVTNGSDYYKNNAKYYAEEAASVAAQAAFEVLDTVDNHALLPYPTKTIENQSIVSFDDGIDGIPLKELEFKIEPVQDLHGYNNPWPAGGGKNLLPAPANATKTQYGVTVVVTDGVYKVTGTATDTVCIWFDCETFVIPNGGDTNKLYFFNNQIVTAWFSLSNNNEVVEDWQFNSVNRLATYSAMSGKTANKLGIKISEGQTYNFTFSPAIFSASLTNPPFEPYSNICPISGHTECEVVRSGINIWDEEWESGGLHTDGTKIDSQTNIRTKNYLSVKGGTKYYFVSPYGAMVCYYDKNKQFISLEYYVRNGYEITVPENACYVLFRLPNDYGTTYANDVSFNYPYTDHNYHPAKVTTYEITFKDANDDPLTVYGGTVKVNQNGSGQLVVDRAIITGLDQEWWYNPNATSYPNIFAMDLPERFLPNGYLISNTYNGTDKTWNTLSNLESCVQYGLLTSGKDALVIRDNSYTDRFEFKGSLEGCHFVAKLATPLTYDLTAEQIETILGRNNIWVDTGDITKCTYRTALATGQELDVVDEYALSAYALRKVENQSLVHLEDAAAAPIKKMVIGIDPVQDLHGYDHPWPAGGGKNKFNDVDPTLSSMSVNNGVFTNTKADSREYINLVIQGLLNGNIVNSNIATRTITTNGISTVAFTINTEIDSLRIKHSGSSTDLMITFPFDGQGDCVFSCNVTGHNPSIIGGVVLKECQLESGTFVTSYAPYSNICPISGHTECEVVRTGKNLLDSAFCVDRTAAGVTSTRNSDGTITLNGSPTTRRFWNPNDTLGLVLPPGTYTCGQYIGLTYSGGEVYGTFTITEETTFINAYFAGITGTLTNLVVYPQLEVGSTATSYEQFQGTTYDIDFPSEAGTVYGGTLTVHQDGTGTLVVDKGGIILDNVNHSFTNQSGYWHIAPYNYGAVDASPGGNLPDNTISSFYNGRVNWGATSNGTVIFTRASNWTGVFEDVAAINNFIEDTPQQLVYELATPQTYHLTIDQVKTLLGTNNIWSNTGDILELDYRAIPAGIDDIEAGDATTKATLESMIAGVEASMTASQNYAIGDLVVANHVLYKITATVTSGETLNPDVSGNCEVTTLAAELVALKSKVDTLDAGDIGYSESATYADGSVGAKVSELKTALQSGSEEDAIYHLGFYLDENGDLCQVDDE